MYAQKDVVFTTVAILYDIQPLFIYKNNNMNKKEIIQHRSQIKNYLLLIQRASIAILYLSLLGFSASIFLLLDKQLILSVVLATSVFFLARLLRSNVAKFARWRLKDQEAYEDMFSFIDKEQKGREEMVFLELLRKAIGAVE